MVRAVGCAWGGLTRSPVHPFRFQEPRQGVFGADMALSAFCFGAETRRA